MSMSFRIVGARVTLMVLISIGFLSSAVAQDLTVPQNFRASEVAGGPGRSQVSLVLEWGQAMKQGTTVPYTEYQLGRGCAYTFSGQDKAIGGNSGTVIMSGPGPAYRVNAVCSCNHGAIAPAVRVSAARAAWVYVANPPGEKIPTNPAAFTVPCMPAK